MEAKKAVDFYTGKAGIRLNCAQAVAAAFESEYSHFSSCGGGNAPNGWCGAAYVAAKLINDPTSVESAYVAQAGTVKCHELRSGRKMSCLACVEKGAQLVKSAR